MSVHVAKPEGSPPPRANIQMYQIDWVNDEYSRTDELYILFEAPEVAATAVAKTFFRATSDTSASNLALPLEVLLESLLAGAA